MSKVVQFIAYILIVWFSQNANFAFAETWYEIKSDNFVIYSDAKDEQITAIANDLEYFRFFLQSLTIVEDTSSVIPLEIYAFKNSRKFRSELKVGYGTGGFYLHNFHGTYAYGDFAKVSLGNMTGREILFHEYVHFFMRQFSEINYPRWYDEGFADYLATFTYDEGTVKIGSVIYNRIYSLETDRWVPVEDFIGSDKWSEIAYDNNVSQANIYAQAWFLVHYLSADPGRKQKLLEFLKALSNGKSHDKAFVDIFKMPFRSLGMELKDYWNSKQIPYTLYDFKNIQFKPTFRIRELSKREGDLVKLKAISHLVQSGYKPKTFFKKANKYIKKFPDSLEAQLLLAEKLYFYGDEKDKKKSEEILAALNQQLPENSQVNSLMGISNFNKINDTVIKEEKDRFAKLGRDYLKKAVTLDPLNVFAQYYLGYSYVFYGSEKPNIGINALSNALDLMPQHNAFLFHYALVNARYGRLDEASYFFRKTKKTDLDKTWSKIADFCLSEIEEKDKNHECVFENFDDFKDD